MYWHINQNIYSNHCLLCYVIRIRKNHFAKWCRIQFVYFARLRNSIVDCIEQVRAVMKRVIEDVVTVDADVATLYGGNDLAPREGSVSSTSAFHAKLRASSPRKPFLPDLLVFDATYAIPRTPAKRYVLVRW